MVSRLNHSFTTVVIVKRLEVLSRRAVECEFKYSALTKKIDGNLPWIELEGAAQIKDET
jgi:hypothetical protein